MKCNVVVKVFFLLVLMGNSVFAQKMEFNKKNGEIEADGKVIAVLEDEKVKGIGKNFILKDATGENELLKYTIYSWQDTFAGETEYYYKVEARQLGYEAYRPNFTGMINTFKEVGEHIIEKNLLNADGTLNDVAAKGYFMSYAKQYPYDQWHARINDSLLALVSIPAQPVERDRMKPFTANEFGKIGQGNTVIGTWEYLEKESEGFNKSATHLFVIRNMNGGIVCISWIEISGAHTYMFKDGVRTKEKWTVPDFVNNNPIHNKEKYVAQLAENLAKAGLL